MVRPHATAAWCDRKRAARRTVRLLRDRPARHQPTALPGSCAVSSHTAGHKRPNYGRRRGWRTTTHTLATPTRESTTATAAATIEDLRRWNRCSCGLTPELSRAEGVGLIDWLGNPSRKTRRAATFLRHSSKRRPLTPLRRTPLPNLRNLFYRPLRADMEDRIG